MVAATTTALHVIHFFECCLVFSQHEDLLRVRAPPSSTATVARTILSAGRGTAIVVDDESDTEVLCYILIYNDT
jgi:hypothetical protein